MSPLPVAPLAEPVELTTRSGLRIEVREAEPDDAPLLEAMFDGVAAQDLRFRFLSACHHISADQIAMLVNVDHWRTESLLAFHEGELIATAMLACDAAMDTAEVAVSIRADHKGQGVGWTLLNFVAGEAMRRGVKRLISVESRENHAAIELEREMGFVARPVEGDPALVLLEARF